MPDTGCPMLDADVQESSIRHPASAMMENHPLLFLVLSTISPGHDYTQLPVLSRGTTSLPTESSCIPGKKNPARSFRPVEKHPGYKCLS
jgi:hypothetical protein